MSDSVYIKHKTNKHRKLNDMFITVLLVFYVLWRMPIVSYYMNTYIAMMALVLLTVLVAFYDSKYFTGTPRVIIALIPFLLLTIGDQFLMGATTSNSVVNVIWLIFLDVMPVFVGSLLVYNKMDFAIKALVPTIIASHIVTALTTYVGLLRFPEASRIMATGGTHFERYYVYNIGGFAFIYSLVLLHPIFIGYFKTKHRYIFSALTTVITALCVFESEYTTAALLFILSCIAYFLPAKLDMSVGKGRRIVLIVLFLIAIVVMLPAILNALAEWDILESSSEKLRDIVGMLQGKEAVEQDIIARQEVYSKSWETFMENPIFGAGLSGGGSYGGHSYFLDILAGWGIVGITIVIFMLTSFIGLYRKLSKETTAYYYTLVTFILSFILSILNPKLWTYQLGFAAPILIYDTVNMNPKLNKIEEK